LPGHGGSPSPTGRNYRIEDFVQDVVSVFDNLGIEKAIMIGLSMGGIVAQQIAIGHPQLIDGLVLTDTTSHGVGDEGKADAFLAAIDASGIKNASQMLVVRSFGSAASPEIVNWAKQQVLQTPEFVARSAIQSISDSDTRPQLGQISCPTLVIVGESDVITPPHEAEILSRTISDSTLSVIPGAGHFPMLEQPAKFNAALRGFVERRLSTNSPG
jgi:3-oxoadipate enol-lactonase